MQETSTEAAIYSAETEITVFFDVITQHSIQINDSITDNWLENSTVVNDCIAQAPITVSLSGVSGELVYKSSDFQEFLLDFGNTENADFMRDYERIYGVNDKLSALTSLYPPVDNITQTAINIKDAAAGNIDRYKGIFSRLKGGAAASNNTQFQETPVLRQKRLERIYEGILRVRTESKKTGSGLTVITPYTQLKNMFIETVTLSQDNLKYITDISMTLKQINFSEITAQGANKEVYAEFNANARAAVENQGKVSGHNVSFLKRVYSGGN